MTFHLIIKGKVTHAINTAARYGITLRGANGFLAGVEHWETTAYTEAEEAKVQAWFNVASNDVPPYPIGTLLFYTRA